MNVLGLSPVLAIVAALRMHRPAALAAPWVLFAVGFAALLARRPLHVQLPAAAHRDVPFPSLGDAAYILVYPALMAGLLMLVRRRNPEPRPRAASSTRLIMTLGLALPSWVALIAPYLHDDSLAHGREARLGRLPARRHPAAGRRRSAWRVDAGRREPAFYLLELEHRRAAGHGLRLRRLITLNGSYDDQLILDVGWISFYLLWGAAALHPSMRGLEQPGRDRDPKPHAASGSRC